MGNPHKAASAHRATVFKRGVVGVVRGKRTRQVSAIRGGAALLACVGLLLVGCQPAPADEPPSESSSPGASPSVAPSPTVDPAEEQARQDILEVYDSFREASITAAATADYESTELAEYVAQPLLGEMLNSLQQMSEAGIHNTGRPTWSPTVTALRLDTSPPSATIEDCLDITGWLVVDDNGEPLPAPSGLTRYVVVVQAKQVSDRWYIYETVANRSQAC